MATSVFTGYFPITDAGEILVGARVFILDVGTTNLKAIYSDTALSSAIDNPMDTDADGFHPQAYLSGSYKVRIETGGTDTLGSGTLIRQWDNIDGGVPVGSGDLAVADGGTGASTAAAARTNLSVPSQSEVDDLSAELAELAGTIGSTGATQLATGTTAQRPTDLAAGQVRRNTTTSRFEGYTGSGWEDFASTTATQAIQETGTSTEAYVTSGRQHFHQSAAKGWAMFNTVTTTAVLASYNVSSLTDEGGGDTTLNFTTAFSSASYGIAGITRRAAADDALALAIKRTVAPATTALRVATFNNVGSAEDAAHVGVTLFGDR
jgi:hypothetical protein